ncbi:hypothetical protein F5Y10DRAFT_240182 [Nemania abortiva]|nr:hypothetical protein F5Y10DRAFT_240182 [Nemania abortiva]
MTLGVKYRDDIHGELDELRFSLSRAFSLRQELYRRRLNSRPAGCVRADHPIPPNRKFYFEVKIISVKQASLRFRIFRNVAIGFSHSNSTLDGLPGYRETKSWGYNGDDGKLYSTGAAVPGVRCDTFGEVGDVVGCCIDPTDGTAFFTKNGERQDGLIRGIHGKIFPLVYIMGGVEVRAYFPAQKASFLFDINTVSGGECFTP